MCKFFSVMSNGKGTVLFLTLKDIEKIEKAGNPDSYKSWNSHTTIAYHFKVDEDKWNKWEYDCEKKELKADSLVTNDDSKSVKAVVEKYLAKNNALYLQKVYKRNTGDRNTGDNNTGDWNTGDRNTGNLNTGDRNTGDLNTGHRNTGHKNTGYKNTGHNNTGYNNTGDWNTGNRNTGDRNIGDRNIGHSNTGQLNTGDRNTGHWNTGHWNTGNSNTGHWNTGDRNTGNLNTDEPPFRIFNKTTHTKKENINYPDYFYFDITRWIEVSEMTEQEKETNWWYQTTEGYLKIIDYKEAWKQSFNNATKEDVARTLKLPNFNYEIFEELSGITKEMIDKKTKG